MGKHNALKHEPPDAVAVVIVDIAAGGQVSAVNLEGVPQETVVAVNDIPLGHKIALRDIAAGEQVIKYGRSIGKAAQAIKTGEHVHIHNVKSERWA
jgi:(2R)-sulfolactate sulfo-lyase subunit alpha